MNQKNFCLFKNFFGAIRKSMAETGLNQNFSHEKFKNPSQKNKEIF